MHCLVVAMQEWSENALAVVISTPDRVRWRGDTKGPPPNRRHVREWMSEEMEILLLDSGMFPLYSGMECGSHGHCKNGFTPQNLSLFTHIHFIANTQVGYTLHNLSLFTQEGHILHNLSLFTQVEHILHNLSLFTLVGHILHNLSLFTQGGHI